MRQGETYLDLACDGVRLAIDWHELGYSPCQYRNGHVRTCATFSIIAGYATVIITWWQRQSHSILLHISYQSHASPTPFTLHHAPFSYQTLDSLMTVSGLLLGAILSHFCDCQEYGVRMVGVWRENGRRPRDWLVKRMGLV